VAYRGLKSNTINDTETKKTDLTFPKTRLTSNRVLPQRTVTYFLHLFVP